MRNLFLIILFFTLSLSVFAVQQDSLVVDYDKNSDVEFKKFDSQQIDKYKSDDDFDYTVHESKPTIFSKIWSWFKRNLLRLLEWIFGVGKAGSILAMILQSIPYIILLVVLFIIIKLFLKVDTNSLKTGRTQSASVQLTEDEEIINNKNIPNLIQKAIKDKNFRLAVRYYYLLILQKLQENQLIEWEQQKTNEDYIKEIKQPNVTKKFSEITYLYDFVWYGNFEINEVEFAKVEANFDSLTKSIK